MSFFSSSGGDADGPVEDDVGDVPAPPPPWEGPPDAEVPAVLPVSALLSATEQAAIVLTGVRVFSTGVELGIDVKARRGELSEDDWDELQDRIRGFGHRRARRLDRSGRLRVGLVLADGRHVLAGGLGAEGPDPEAAEPRLRQTGGSGSGGDRSWVSSWNYWLWPLPPDGALTVVADWPQLGVAERSVVVDGSGLASLAGRARPIWPDSGSAGRGPQPTWSITF